MYEITKAKFDICEDLISSSIDYGTSGESFSTVKTNKTKSKLDNQGCNKSWNRSYRIAARFFGVLCAVLLVAIIVLCVEKKLFKSSGTDGNQHQVRYHNLSLKKEHLENSYHQFLTSYNSMEEERDLLQAIISNITKEKVQLQTVNNNLMKEKDQLQTVNNNLMKEKDQLQTVNSNLMKEKDQLQTVNNNLMKEKDQLQTVNSNLMKEKDQLQTLNNNLAKERNQSETRYKAMTEQRDQIQNRFNNMVKEKNRLNTLTSNLVEEKRQLQTQKNNLNKERDQLLTESGGLRKALSVLGWKYFGSSVYFISNVKMNWTNGREHCRKKGAELVVINSKEEMIFAHSLISELGAWLGLTDKESEGVWKWVDGTKLTTSYWAKGQPDNGGRSDSEDCGAMAYKLPALESWSDGYCHYISYVICEKSVKVQ